MSSGPSYHSLRFPRFLTVVPNPGCLPQASDLSLFWEGSNPSCASSSGHLSHASLPTCISFFAHSTLGSAYPVLILSPLLDYQLCGLRIHVKFTFVSSAVPDMLPHSGYYLILIE